MSTDRVVAAPEPAGPHSVPSNTVRCTKIGRHVQGDGLTHVQGDGLTDAGVQPDAVALCDILRLCETLSGAVRH